MLYYLVVLIGISLLSVQVRPSEPCLCSPTAEALVLETSQWKFESSHKHQFKMIVNRHYQKYDVYIGRPTIYGNPYIIGKHGDRGQCVKLFKEYFYIRLNNDPEFKQAIDSLRGKVLGCSCKPKACHGDVIEEYLYKKES